MDKLHWFLCGLGPSFESFSLSIKTVKPGPAFRDLVSQAESHEMFLKSIHASSPPVAAFNANHNRSPPTKAHKRGRYNTYRGRGGSNNQNGGKGRGSLTPRCQLCRTFGHYASECPNYTFTARTSSTEDDIAKAFHAKCHVTHDTPDWKVDSGATAHMTSNLGHLHHTHHHNHGNLHVTFANGHTLPVTRTGTCFINKHLPFVMSYSFLISQPIYFPLVN
ncbi:uncharacterized protein LOC143533863 [Bidens hawaiensis]|uniref:uncharacterized protein LOC143533863 n=1 Tax=Bidens hawaiensis TaxID=980011 RepID=UPI00404B7371